MRATFGVIALCFVCCPAAFAEPRIEIEVVMQGNVPPSAPQQWNRALGQAGFDRATIRDKRINDKLGIRTIGTGRNPVYRVTALLSGDTLVLPPRTRFRQRDVSRMAKWIADLKVNGPEGTTSPKVAFGLTPKQLQAVNEDLKAVSTVATKGEKSADVVNRLTRNLQHPLVIDSDAQRALGQDASVRDELSGLSTGTTLAAVLRPAGLILRPRSKAGQVELVIMDSRNRTENWPIGWEIKKAPGQIMPKLFEKEKTQEVEVPLQAALGELSNRIGAAMLLDHNGMAVHRIDVQTPVKMKAGNQYYSSVISHILRQVDMHYEIRVDENDKPFLWITPGR